MTKQELKKKFELIEHEAELKKKDAIREYIETNALYRIGDVVSDSSGTICVERIGYSRLTNDGSVVIYYFGHILTKKGLQKKNGQTMCVFESAIIK